MKKLLPFCAVLFALVLQSQVPFPQLGDLENQPINNWQISSAKSSKSFIENKGQFDSRNKLPGSEILYAVDHGELQIFFTRQGVTYYVERKVKNPNRQKGDRTRPKLLKEYEVVHFTWDGANPYAELIGEKVTADYHTYSFLKPDKSSAYTFDNVRGFEKIVYKNLYPGIDIEYVFHHEIGLKYSVILHPGADASLLKMKYSYAEKVSLTGEGQIIIPTFLGEIIEHKPVTFYADNNSKRISSQFIQSGATISFQLGKYNHSKQVVIDPWVQTPTLSNSNCVWECERDAAGNVYIIGGDAPMRLRKYNSIGALQWTYVTPWDTTNDGDWLGTLATDLAGNSYVTNGSVAAMHKVNTNGGLTWSANGGALDEYWSIAFNCDQTRLIVGGTRLNPLLINNSHGVIFDINTNNGSASGSIINVTGVRSYTLLGLPVIDPNEVRAISSSKNAKYYYLTHDTIGAINQNFNACSSEPLFARKSTYEFAYKSENYRPNNGNAGICAIKANDQFVYTQNGNTVHKRSLNTGAIISSAPIPGGISTTVALLNFNQPGNNGIDIDDCGNVYVGSADRVIKYDANLNVITSVNLPFRVFDVEVSTNGDVIVCGATGTSSTVNRTGYVQSLNMGACAPFPLVCCDATACPAGPFCHTDAPVTLSSTSSGGTWSGTGITNASTGAFSPAVAGPGTHTITHTLACGSDQITIVVNDCAMLSVCIETNGQYTVSGGTGPHTWESGVPFQNCTQCFFGICNPLCPGFPDTTWTTFATGTTVTPPGTFPLRVRDSGVNSFLITSAANLPNCSTMVCPTITVNILTQTNTCPGTSNGSATVNATGGTTPYTYNWQPGSLNGASQSGLAAGAYTIVATDANNCTGTTTVTITSPSAINLSTSKTDATCAGNNGTASVTASGGTPSYSYVWSNGPTTASISGLAPGNYTVTVRDNNNCSATASVTISSSGGATVTLASQTNISCYGAGNGAINISVTGGASPYTFAWTNSATTEDISGLAPGSYTVSVTDNNSCVSVLTATITQPDSISATGAITNGGCGTPTGAIDLSVSGGTAPYSYSWTGGATTQDLTNIPSGNYSVTITDNNSCTKTLSFVLTAPGTYTVTLTPVSTSCPGVDDGSISLSTTGGTSPFQYLWNTSATSQNLTGLASGSYSVTVTDNNNCTVSASVTVGSLPQITFNTSITKTLCEDGNNGGIKLSPAGGTPPYSADWSNLDTSLSIQNLSPGVYDVTVTDANGCTRDTSIALTSVSQYQIELVVTNTSCDGSEPGSVQVNVLSPTTPPYSFVWNTSDTADIITNLTPGEYSVTVTDSLSCLRMDSAVVAVGGGLLIAEEVMDVTCPGRDDGAITVTVTGGTEPYVYVWNTGATTASLQNISEGVYTLVVTDQNDCSGSDTILVSADSSGTIDCDTLIIYDIFSPNGDGTNDLWIIDGLTSYPDNEVQIFNRWGNKVFEAKPYNNNWDGTSKNGGELPAAAYYYILKLNDPDKTVHSGAITLIR